MSQEKAINFLAAAKAKEKEINEAVAKLKDFKKSLDKQAQEIEAERVALEQWAKRLRYQELRINKILKDREIEEASVK